MDRDEIAEIVEKLCEYRKFVKKFAKEGLLEPEELEMLKKVGILNSRGY